MTRLSPSLTQRRHNIRMNQPHLNVCAHIAADERTNHPYAILTIDGATTFHYCGTCLVTEVCALASVLDAEEIAAMVSFGPPAGSCPLADNFSTSNTAQKTRYTGDAVYSARLYSGTSLLADQARARLRHLETVEQHRQVNPLRTPSHTLVVIPPAPHSSNCLHDKARGE